MLSRSAVLSMRLFFLRNLKFVLFSGPADNTIYQAEHCVKMTPQKEDEVNSIVVKLSEYIYNLTLEYDDLDIRLVKVVVESHSENEVEEKETQVQLLVNDCAYVDDMIENKDGTARIEGVKEKDGKTIEIDFVSDDLHEPSKVVQSRKDNYNPVDEYGPLNDKRTAVGIDGSSKVPEVVKTKPIAIVEETSVESPEIADSVLVVENPDETVTNSASGNPPEVMFLNLDERGNEVVKLREAKYGKTPLLVYVQKVLDNIQYWFLN